MAQEGYNKYEEKSNVICVDNAVLIETWRVGAGATRLVSESATVGVGKWSQSNSKTIRQD